MIEPVTYRIVVQPFKIEEQDEAYKAATRMNLHIVGKEKDREQAAVDRGVVVATGPSAFQEFGCDNPLKVGDEIIYARHSGKDVTDPETEEKFVIINDSDVVAIIRKEA